MGTFTDPLFLEYLDGADWRVTHPFVYVWHTDREMGPLTIRVPAGFVTDFASIPRFFWRVLPPTGAYGKAAVVHDYLYRTPAEPYTRQECDEVFLSAMQDLGVSWPVRQVMFWAVRLFGCAAYRDRPYNAIAA
jgi:hypothetical protein